jgi:hypothetical protein
MLRANFARLHWGVILHPYIMRPIRHTWTPTVFLLATIGFTAKPALAEFEIQESQIKKGEIELEYRGAVHWGIPKQTEHESVLEEGEAGLRQSHDFELEWGFADRWLVTTTLITDQPVREEFNVGAVEAEMQYELIEREGDGIGLAFQAEYGFAARGGEADEVEFGPIVDVAKGKLVLTFNPLFTAQVGNNATSDSLGFQYGWRAEYDFAKHWGIGVEMFGEIEDLANAGSFNDQNHSIGPTIFYSPTDETDAVEEATSEPGPAQMELTFNVGVQFGLTDATSDTALKFQGSLSF